MHNRTTNFMDRDKPNDTYKKDFSTLKSTNLILKTMNLADEFDETMKAFQSLKLDKVSTEDSVDGNVIKPLAEMEPQSKPDLVLSSEIPSKPIIPVVPSRQKNLYSNTIEGKLRQLKQLYENQEACEEKISLNKIDLKREVRLDPTSEISGSWHRVKVKKKNTPEAHINVPKTIDEPITTGPSKPKVAPRTEKKETICDIFSSSNKTHLNKDSLPGMRKLREHELTFFGVKSDNRMKTLDNIEKKDKIKGVERYVKPRINLIAQKEMHNFKLESQKQEKHEKHEKPTTNLKAHRETNTLEFELKANRLEKHEKPRTNLEAHRETYFKGEFESQANRIEKHDKPRTNIEAQKEIITIKSESHVEPTQKKTMKSIGIQVCVPEKARIHKTVHASISKTGSSKKIASTDSKSRSSSSKERPKMSKKKI